MMTDIKESDIEKWFKLTYDENPKIRLKAAKQLAQYPDSPLSIFALYELSYDKNETVKQFAIETLKDLKLRSNGNENEYSLSNLLATKTVDEKQIEKQKRLIDKQTAKIKARLLPNIERYYFSGISAQKKEHAKKMLMPSLERLFERLAVLELTGDRETAERISRFVFGGEKGEKTEKEGTTERKKEIERKLKETEGPTERPVERLEDAGTKQLSLFEIADEEEGLLPDEYRDYLNVMSQIERIVPEPAKHDDIGGEKTDLIDTIVVTKTETPKEPKQLRSNSYEEILETQIFNRALKLYRTPGITNAMIRKEMKRIMKEMEMKVKAAFDLAKMRSKRYEIESLLQLEDGMTNIYTGELRVVLVEDRSIKIRKRNVHRIRIIVTDGRGNQFPVYLKGNRGRGIYEGDIIKFENAKVETFPSTGETVLTLDRKGRAILVR